MSSDIWSPKPVSRRSASRATSRPVGEPVAWAATEAPGKHSNASAANKAGTAENAGNTATFVVVRRFDIITLPRLHE